MIEYRLCRCSCHDAYATIPPCIIISSILISCITIRMTQNRGINQKNIKFWLHLAPSSISDVNLRRRNLLCTTFFRRQASDRLTETDSIQQQRVPKPTWPAHGIARTLRRDLNSVRILNRGRTLDTAWRQQREKGMEFGTRR